MNLLRISLLFIFAAAILLSCNKVEVKKEQTPEKAKKQEVQKVEVKEIPSVCVWEKGSVRKEPVKKGKFLSAMSLGEKIIYLGESSIDKNDKNKTYYKIKLSDGKIGWASQYVLAIDAKPAVALEEIPIYRRPELITLTESTFDKMDFVAVAKAEGNWLQVYGKEKKKKGWIQKNSVSFTDENIAVGLLAGKALDISDEAKKEERIKSIINNPALSKSVFIRDLQNILNEKKIESENQEAALE